MTTLSITAAMPGTNLSTSHGASCPSDCATGRMGTNQNDLVLKALHALFRWAIEEELVANDPTIGARTISKHSDGHHSWTAEEIAAFEAVHPIGSQARLAM